MQITQGKNHTKIILVLGAIIVLAASVGVLYYLKNVKQASNQSTSPSINLNKPTTGEIEAGEQAKKSTIDNTQKNSDTSTPSDQTSADTPIIVSLHGMQSNTQVNFDTVIDIISNDGQCTLSLASGGKTITKSAGMFANPSSSSCKGFAIPTSELTKGTWTATLHAVVGSRSGQATTTVEVQ